MVEMRKLMRKTKLTLSTVPLPEHDVVTLPQATKGAWRETKNGSEYAGEMKRVGKTRLFRHLFYQSIGLLQALSGEVHLKPEQILERTLGVVAPEQAAEVGVVNMAFVRNLLQGSQAQAVLFDMLTTSLKGHEGLRFRAYERCTCPSNSKRQALQQFRAQHRALAARPQSGLDEFVKERLQRIGRKDF